MRIEDTLEDFTDSEMDDAPDPKREEFNLKVKLLRLLFTPSNVLPRKATTASLDSKEVFRVMTTTIEKDWITLSDSTQQEETLLLDLAIKSKLKEWVLERVAHGCITSDRDQPGQGVVHLCTKLDYRWAVKLYSRSGLSLDFRDTDGWTPLHWAAFLGRHEMVALLVSEGADPSLVTYTSENFGRCTASDLASQMFFHGIAAYLAEQSLITQLVLMSVNKNISTGFQLRRSKSLDPGNLCEEQLGEMDAREAYETSLAAAARIRALLVDSVTSKASSSSVHYGELYPIEAPAIVSCLVQSQGLFTIIDACKTAAAMKIQHAFRIHMMRQRVKAASKIEQRYLTWAVQKNSVSNRLQVVKLQANPPGHTELHRRHSLIWAVGVLEKIILRWRRKGNGLRGFNRAPAEKPQDMILTNHSEIEERLHKALNCVESILKSSEAQKDYRMLKLLCTEEN